MIIIIPAIVIITTTRGDIEFWPYHHQRHHHHQNDHQALPVRKIQVRQPTSCFFHPLLLHSEQMGVKILIRMTTIYILWWSVCGFVCHEKLPLSQVVYVCLSVCNVLKVTPQFECLVWWVDDKVSVCLWSFIFIICSSILSSLSWAECLSFCQSHSILTFRSTIQARFEMCSAIYMIGGVCPSDCDVLSSFSWVACLLSWELQPFSETLRKPINAPYQSVSTLCQASPRPAMAWW